MGRKENRKRIAFISIIAAIVLLNAVYALNYPILIDEAGFIDIGNGIVHGLAPYEDFYDNKAPGVHYLSATIIQVFGNSIYLIRLVLLFMNIVTGFMVYKISKRLWNSDVGIVAFVLFMLGIVLFANGTLYTEIPLIFLLTLGTLLFLESVDSGKRIYLFASGIFFGIGFIMRISAILTLIAIFAFYVLGLYRRENRNLSYYNKIFIDGIFIVCGFVIPVVIALILFFMMGSLNELIYNSFILNLFFYPSYTLIDGAKLYYSNIVAYLFLWVFVVSGFVLIIKNYIFKRSYDKKFAIALFFFFSMTQLTVAGFAHYFLQALPYAAMIGSYALFAFYKEARKSDFMEIFAVIAITCLLLSSISIITFTLFRLYDYDALGKQMDVGNYIKSVTGEDERIFILGSGIEYFFLSDRQPSYRYFFYQPLIEHVYSTTDAIESLEEYNVRYIIITDLHIIGNDDRKSAEEKLAPLYDYIYENYEIDREFIDVLNLTVYKLK